MNVILTKQAVFQAADKRVVLGIHPRKITAPMLRQVMGGGSYATLLPLLREWADKRPMTPVEVAHE